MPSTTTTRAGDMWDAIAKRVYGDEAAMNVLIDANSDYVSTYVFPAGVELVVPDYEVPITSVLPPWRRDA